jgi:hypothetical protein
LQVGLGVLSVLVLLLDCSEFGLEFLDLELVLLAGVVVVVGLLRGVFGLALVGQEHVVIHAIFNLLQHHFNRVLLRLLLDPQLLLDQRRVLLPPVVAFVPAVHLLLSGLVVLGTPATRWLGNLFLGLVAGLLTVVGLVTSGGVGLVSLVLRRHAEVDLLLFGVNLVVRDQGSNHFPHILLIGESLQNLSQAQQFSVIGIVVPAYNRQSILRLKEVGCGRIVYNDYVFHTSAQTRQVFYMDVVVKSAVLAEQLVRTQACRVQLQHERLRVLR